MVRKTIIINEKQAKKIKDAMSQVHNKVNAACLDSIMVCEDEIAMLSQRTLTPEEYNSIEKYDLDEENVPSEYEIGYDFPGDPNSYAHVIKERKNDAGQNVPKKCSCGGDIALEVHGEPIYICKKCRKYFGTLPFKSSLNEDYKQGKNFDYKTYMKSLLEFFDSEGVEVKPYPKITLKDDEQEGLYIKTGYYDPTNRKIVVFTRNRHEKDVMRSFAHELWHHHQALTGMLANNSYKSQTISDDDELIKLEADAYLNGNIYFRKWTEAMKPDMYDNISKVPINESYLPEVNQNLSDIEVLPCFDYYNDNGVREICHKIKDGDAKAIQYAGEIMSKYVKPQDILVPIPSRVGVATQTLQLCKVISQKAGAEISNVLTGKPRESFYDLKKKNIEPDKTFFSFQYNGAEGKNIILVDNVLDTGRTAREAADISGAKKLLVFARVSSNMVNEELLEDLNPEDVDLSSFDVQDELNPRIWKDGVIDSRIRLDLMDIADDFIDFLGVDWVEPKDVIITGSIANYNWSSEFSDIDLHVVMDFSEVDSKTEFVKEYFDSKKKIWNEEHSDIKIMGFPVEVYVQDINEKHSSSGVYSLNRNAWVIEPDVNNFNTNDFDDETVKYKVSEYANIIDKLLEAFNDNNDDYVLRTIYKKTIETFKHIKHERTKNFDKGEGEYGNGNIIFKTLRRNGYIEKLLRLKRDIYNKIKTID